MKQIETTAELNRKKYVILFLVFLYFVFDLAASRISLDYRFPDEFVNFYPIDDPSIHWSFSVVLGLFFAQASLVALWADRCTLKSYFRIPLAFLAVGAISYCLSENVAETPLREGVNFFLLFAIFVSLIILLLSVLRFLLVFFEDNRDGVDFERRKSVQFSIGTMLVWMTIIAVILGLGKMLSFQSGTTFFARLPYHDRMSAYFPANYFITVFHAIFALMGFYIALSGRRFLIWSLIILVLIQLLSWLEAFIVNSEDSPFQFVAFTNVKPSGFIVMANVQIILTIASLLPLRRYSPLSEDQKSITE